MSTTPVGPQGVFTKRCCHTELRVTAFAHIATSTLRCILKYSGHTIQHQCAFRLLQRDHRTVFMKRCCHNMAARQKEACTLKMEKRDATATRTLFLLIIHLVFWRGCSHIFSSASSAACS